MEIFTLASLLAAQRGLPGKYGSLHQCAKHLGVNGSVLGRRVKSLVEMDILIPDQTQKHVYRVSEELKSFGEIYFVLLRESYPEMSYFALFDAGIRVGEDPRRSERLLNLALGE